MAPDTTAQHSIISLSFDSAKPSITIESSWIVIALLCVGIIILTLLRRRYFKNYQHYNLEVEISGSPKMVFKVDRNYENLYIANRIYIELTTRKAAIIIDENNDIIEEVYDSWYSLFGIIRDEIKSLPGKYLKDHDPTAALMGLSRKILNEAMRPHLTEYQAKFRKWLAAAKEDPHNKDLTPQELQKKYPDFDNLVASMKEVNLTLINYSQELDKLIKGK